MATNFFGMKRSGSSGSLGGLNAMVDDNFQYALGPPESGFSIFLAERTKKVHFIRHAEVSYTMVDTVPHIISGR
jgi:hypothetical protein